MAGNKTRTNRLTNTDTGRGLWPPAGGGAALRRGKGDGLCHGGGGKGDAWNHLPPRLRAGPRKRTAFPPPLRNSAAKTVSPSVTQASARPGGGEARAVGGAGAGRGLWPPAARGVTESPWQRRWPLPWWRGAGGTLGFTFRPLSGREEGNATRVSPAPARRRGKDRLTQRNAGQRPTRRARSARQGRGGRWPGALAPGWRRGSVALWQRRWPLPWGGGTHGTTFRLVAGREQGNATRVSPAPTERCGKDPRTPHNAGQRLTRRARSARPRGGAGAGRGLWPPAARGGSVSMW
jgi:hypothetical protein